MPPLVVVFGWWFNKPKHLKKYVDIYKSLGYETFSYTSPSWTSGVFHPKGSNPILPKVEQICKDKGSKQVFLHVMSNQGMHAYQNFIRALGDGNKTFEVKGAVFDSCPGYMTWKSGVTAILQSRPPVMLQLALLGVVCSPFLGIMAAAGLVKGSLLIFGLLGANHLMTKKLQSSIDQRLLSASALSFPHLYIYSKSDDLVSYKAVESHLMRMQKVQKCITYETKVYDDTPHVGHFLKYPDEYKETIQNFLQKQLVEK